MSSFYIEQFGCRATQADGAALERQLLDRGFTPSRESASADIVVINTCTVTSAADAQARDSIRKLHAANPAARVIVTGCYAQRAPEELAELSGVTWVVGNSHKPQIPGLIQSFQKPTPSESSSFVPLATLESNSLLAGAFLSDSAAPLGPSVEGRLHLEQSQGIVAPERAKILTGDIFEYHSLLAAPVLGGEGNHTRPTLKIQDGCNLRCSYCVIPFVRGKSRSLPPDTVIAEIRRLTMEQALLPVRLSPTQATASSHPPPNPNFHVAREIVLSGINLGAYGRDLSPRVEFEDLLRRILYETPLERLRISSIEPQDVTRDLVEMFAASDRIAQHFHMPLQSGSDRILGAMHRWYRTEQYARRVELIHERLPHAAIGADVITGFPGETEEDHAATLAFIERLPFTYLHVFSFSQRPGTKAASLPHQVPGATIKRRARQLRALGERKSAAFRRSQLGRTLRALTLRHEGADTDTTHALSSNYLRVVLSEDFPANQWLDISITAEKGNHLLGESVLCS